MKQKVSAVMLFTGLFTLACSILPTGAVHAQDEEKIEPDRRDFTTGTGIVPQGQIQIESGAEAERRGEEREYTLGEVQVRLPISKRAELRFDIPSFLIQRQGERESGFDDAMVGARFLLVKKEKSEFALQVSSRVPTGSRRVAERRYQPEAILAATFKLSQRSELAVNGAIRRASEEGLRFTQYFAAASFRYDVSPKINAFAELYAFNKQEAEGSSQKFAAIGAVYYLNPRTALDARFGSGLGNDVGGPDYFYGAGLSRLF